MDILEEEFLRRFGEPPDGVKDLVFGAVKRAREEWDAADDEQKAGILRSRVFSAKMFNEAVDSQSETLQRAALEIWNAGLSSQEAQLEWITSSINTMVEKEERRMNLEHERNRAPVALMLDQGWLSTLSAEPYRGLQHSIAHKNLFRPNDEGLPHREIPGKNGARTSITIKADELARLLPAVEREQWVGRMWENQRNLSDLDLDCLDILMAMWIEKARTSADVAVADIDDILAMRGLERHAGGDGRRGGYRDEQREQVIASISRLQDVMMEWEGPKVSRGQGKKPRPEVVQSHAVVITDLKGQRRLDGGVDVDTIIFQPGRIFGGFLQTVGRQTALLAHKALSYNPYTQAPEKRLTRFLAWQWRVRAHQSSYDQPFRVQSLMEEASIEFDPVRPKRAQDRLEKALDQLLEDKVINNWDYDRETWDEERDGGRPGWRHVWTNATIIIEAPDAIRDHYRTIEREAPSTPKAKPKPSGDLVERMAAERKARGISQAVISEILGVHRSYVGNIERGKEKVSARMRTKIEAWLKSLEADETAGNSTA